MSVELDSVASDASGATDRARHVPGEEGLWVFLLGDMLVFALFFGSIVVAHGDDPEAFRTAQQALHPELGIVNTMLLLTGSILVVWAIRALRAGAGTLARRLTAAAVTCGLGFAAIKATEYVMLLSEGYGPGDNDFFMYYFVYTGIHLGHLVIGVVLLAVLALRCHRIAVGDPGLGRRRMSFAEGVGCYWHMVDLLWLVLFPLLYLVR